MADVAADVPEDQVVAALAVALRDGAGLSAGVLDRALRRGPAGLVGPLTHAHPLLAAAGEDVGAVAARTRLLGPDGPGYAALRYASAHGARLFAGLPEADVLVTEAPGDRPALEPATSPYRVVATRGRGFGGRRLHVAAGVGLPPGTAGALLCAWRAGLPW